MTKNKKKLRRVERRYSVTKSAQTLVLAGLLLAGGVSGAMAADPWAGADKTVGAEDTLAVTSSVSLAGTLTITGGTVTVTGSGGSIRATEVNGQASTIKMQGGTLTVKGYSEALQLEITGGTTNIIGADSTNGWRQDALGGYNEVFTDKATDANKPTTVSGAGTIVNIKSANLFGGAASNTSTGGLNILGGATVNLQGAADASDRSKDFDNAGMLAAIGGTQASQVLTISGQGTKVNVAVDNFGVLQAHETIIADGATVNVNGKLLLTGFLGSSVGDAEKVSEALADAEKGKVSQNGGTVNVAGRIYEIGDYTLNSGTLNLTDKGGMIGASSDAMADVTGTFTINGGTLNVGAGTQGSQMQMDKVTIAGGTVNIQGKVGDVSDTWTDNSMIYGGMGATNGSLVAITGGTVTIGNNGQIGVGRDASAVNSMDISGGTVKLQGDTAANAAMLRASSSNSAANKDANGYSALNISNAATIEVTSGKHGAIVSRVTNMSGGTLNVNGSLVVAGSIGAGADITAGIGVATEKWGNFNLSGGSVNVGTAGKLDFATGAVKLNIGGSGVLNTTDMTIASAAVPAGGKGLYAKDVTINSGGSLIASGNSTLTTGGSLTVASGGKLTLKKDDLLTTTTTSGATHTFAKNSAWNGTWSLGGTAYLTGFDKNFTYTEDDLSAAYTAVKNGSETGGSVAFIGGTLSGSVSGDVEVSAPDQEVVIDKQPASGGVLTVVEKIEGNTITVADNVNKVTADKGMGLVGSGGTDPLIKDTSGKLVQTIETADGTIGLGNEALKAEVPNQGGKVGDLAVTGTGKVAVEVGNYQAGKVSLVGSGNATLTVNAGGALTADSIKAGSGDIINVGNSAGAGTLISSDVELGGATLFLDPDWTGTQSSVGALVLKDNKLDGKAIVGRNSMLTLGSTDTSWMAQQVTKAGGLKETGITAALGIYKPVIMAAADTLTVNGALYKAESASGSIAIGDIVYDNAGTETKYSPVANTATFAKNSLLAVYAPNMEGTAALTATTGSKLVVDKDAKLMVVDGKVGQTVKITDGFTTPTVDATLSWNGNNLLTNSDMVTGTGTWNSGKYEVVMSRGARAQDLFPLLSGDSAGMVNKMYDMGLNNTQSPHAGIKFLSRATANNEKYVANATEAATTIEGAAQLAVVGATQGVTMSAVTAGSSAAISRTSMASPLMSQKAQAVALNGENLDSGLSAGDVKNGVGLWIMPLYQSTNTWGMKSGEFKTGSTSDLGGVAIGADYTFNDAFRVGVAFNVGGGYAESTGDFNKTDNNFNFWGVNLYGGWAQNNFGITADVGYTSTYSKLEQELQASMDMGAIKADVTSSAITAGLRGEYKFETDALDIIPHVGVRYMSLMTDSYDAKSNGTVFNADESYQSIWTFPIGVTFAKEIESASGWTFRPQLDLQVIPAAGDVKAKSKVRVPGIDSSAELSTRVMDDITYGGGVGFDVKKGDISFGLNYNIQASEHSTSHGVFGTVRYEF